MLATEERPMTGGAGYLRPTALQQAAIDAAYLEAKEFHAAHVRELVIAVLAGRLPFCPAYCRGVIAKMDASDLLDEIGLTDDLFLTARLLAASVDKDAKAESFVDAEALIAAYIDKTAHLLAKEESQS